MFCRENSIRNLFYAAVVALVFGSTAAANGQAVPAPPTSTNDIATTMTASFQTDLESPAQTVTSNTADVTVVASAGVSMTPVLQTLFTLSSGQAIFPMSVLNTGGVDDAYTVQTATRPGWTIALVVDNDSSGVWKPTDTTPLPSTVTLTPGQKGSFFLVMSCTNRFFTGVGETLVTATSSVAPTMYAQALVVDYAHP